MGATHESIVGMVIQQWSNENRGRLFKNHNGTAYRGKKTADYFKNNERIILLAFATIIKYGLGAGSGDLIGWEYVGKYPVICSVEAKTKASPTVGKDQVLWMNNIIEIGGRAYVAKENYNGYNLTAWEVAR